MNQFFQEIGQERFTDLNLYATLKYLSGVYREGFHTDVIKGLRNYTEIL